MKKYTHSKIYKTAFSLFFLLFCMLTFADISLAVTTKCETYSGSNENEQNYTVWSETVKSYLVETEDGQLMRVQGDALKTKYLVEYYDPSYNIQKTRKIAKELSLFGGFYDDGTYYYILSGQENPNEDDSVEVYRLTKYDHQWKRISSAGLYGANTYIPFDAGSARMTHEGNQLFIRTCHEMYKSSDGWHHQANVTIQVNTDSMEVVDSYYGVMNVSYGYVSHSFNQFIQLDEGHIIGLDHGDAYPRSVALTRYRNAYSENGFGKYCDYVEMLPISGATGANSTGVSVGGFQKSDTSYLVAGNSVKMDDNYDPSGVRNIFISTVDRNLTESSKLTWITSYTGSKNPSTPHLLQYGANAYLLLWTYGGKVNYCTLDGTGAKTSAISKMEGSLSDCVPLITDNKAVWYVWDEETVTFYSINLADLTANKAVKIVNGHDYKTIYPAEGSNKVKQICQREGCGKEHVFTTIKSFYPYWKYSENDDGYYWSSYSDEVKKGTWYELMFNFYPDYGVDDYSISITSSDSSIARIVDRSINFVGTGVVTITMKATYNPSCKQTVKFYSGVKNISYSSLTLKYYSTTYNGKVKKPGVTVKYGSKTLVKDTDYKVTYSNNVNAGTAKVKITGIGKYAGSFSDSYFIKKAANTISASNVTKYRKSYTQTFTLKAKALGDAKLSFSSDNAKIKIGSSSGKVTIAKNYRGTATITIKAASTKNYKATTKKVKVTVK